MTDLQHPQDVKLPIQIHEEDVACCRDLGDEPSGQSWSNSWQTRQIRGKGRINFHAGRGWGLKALYSGLRQHLTFFPAHRPPKDAVHGYLQGSKCASPTWVSVRNFNEILLQGHTRPQLQTPYTDTPSPSISIADIKYTWTRRSVLPLPEGPATSTTCPGLRGRGQSLSSRGVPVMSGSRRTRPRNAAAVSDGASQVTHWCRSSCWLMNRSC